MTAENRRKPGIARRGISGQTRSSKRGRLRVSFQLMGGLVLAFWFCWKSAAVSAATGAGPYPFHLPEDFVIEPAVASSQVRFPMFGALDAQGRLYVTESSGGDLYKELVEQTRGCRIRVFEDDDGDGCYDRSWIFADHLVPSMGLVWRGSKLYVADPPDLITLEDTDGDGAADRRTVVLTGFGHTDNGSLHGLAFGPDGMLYLTMGWPDSYRLRGPDGSVCSGKTGALIRCRPDGSRVEALCRGFDQLIELVFLSSGEILGTQTWYQNPSGGIRDALTHLVPGGHYPQQWQQEKPRAFATGPEALPAIHLLPPVAHSGIARYQGNLFPREWRRNLFCAEFNTRKVVSYTLTRSGSTLTVGPRDFVTTDDPDFRPADIVEDADGSLLVVDTGSWYLQHCPTGRMRPTGARGGIYRVRPKVAAKSPDPRGARLDWTHVSEQELAERLSDVRPVVRERAVDWLVRRGESSLGVLTNRIEQAQPEAACLAVWILGRIGSMESRSALRCALGSDNSDVVAAAARALAICRDTEAAAALEKALSHTQNFARLAAAEALAVCGQSGSSAALFAALKSGPDPMLEHALIYALHRVAGLAELNRGLADPDPCIQKAALLVLAQEPYRRLQPIDVLSRAACTNDALRRAALFCLQLRPDWSAHGIAFIRDQLRQPSLSAVNDRALFELLAVFGAEGRLDALMSEALLAPDREVPPSRKMVLLEHMRQALPRRMSPELQEALGSMLRHPELELRLRALRAAGAIPTNHWDAVIAAMAGQSAEDVLLRMDALEILARHGSELPAVNFEFICAQLNSAPSPLTKVRAAEVLASTRPPRWALVELVTVAEAEPAISPNLVFATARRSALDSALLARLLRYFRGRVEGGWAVTEAKLKPFLAVAGPGPEVEALRRVIAAQAEQQQQLLRAYESLLAGGDSNRGRQLFFGKASCATCHRIGKEGRDVGPDLTKIGAIRSGRDLLESVLLPSATFAQGYDTYVVELRDGESVTGTRGLETADAVVLRNTSGAEARIPRSEILSVSKSQLSMMPEGLLQALTRGEAADLLAFLQELK